MELTKKLILEFLRIFCRVKLPNGHRIGPKDPFELLIGVLALPCQISMKKQLNTRILKLCKNSLKPRFFVGHNEVPIRDQTRCLVISYKNRNIP